MSTDYKLKVCITPCVTQPLLFSVENGNFWPHWIDTTEPIAKNSHSCVIFGANRQFFEPICIWRRRSGDPPPPLEFHRDLLCQKN